MTKTDNIFTFLYDFLFVLIDFAKFGWDFLFKTHTLNIDIPFLMIYQRLEFNMLALLLGGGFIFFLTLSLIKKFVPVA